MKIEALDHIHIYSKDPESAATFYKQSFGAEEAMRNVGATGGIRIFLSLGGLMLVIGSFPFARSTSDASELDGNSHQHGMGLDHFGLRVEDLEAAVEELREQGVQILTEPVHDPSGISYAFITAPDGVIVELTQYGSVG